MTDLSGIPDDQLLGMLNQQGSPLAGMSDADLMKALGQPAERSSGAGDFFKSIPGGALSSIGNMLSASGQAASAEMAQPMDIPSPQEAKSALEQNVTGKTYDPQGTAGQYGARVGEALASPFSYLGPGGVLGKAAIAAGGAIGSEAGSQAFKGIAAEIPASIGGAILGGGGVGALGKRLKTPTTAIPTTEELFAAGGKGYEAARAGGLQIESAAGKNLATKIQSELNVIGVDENLAPKTFGILSKLEKAPTDSTMTISNLESLRRTLGNAAGSIDKTERLAAKTAQNALDDYMGSIPAKDVLAGDSAATSKILEEARGNYAAASRSADIDRRMIRAELRAAAANSGQNVANTIRQRMADVLINPAAKRGYSADELQQMEKIVRGTVTGNALRFAGNFLGGGGGWGALMTGGAGALAAGPLGAGLPVAGYALKKLQNLSTMRQAAILDEMLRSRSPLAEKMQALQALAGSAAAPSIGGAQGGLLGALGGASGGILPF